MSRGIHFVTKSKTRLTAFGVLAVALVAGIAAFAYFSSIGTGTGTASNGSLNAPGTPTATASATSGQVDITWHRATLSNNTTLAQKYFVSRYTGPSGGPYSFDGYACGTNPTGGSPVYIDASAANGSGDFTCHDTGLTNASPYSYTVTSIYKSWTHESAKSTPPVTVSLVGPLDHFVLAPAFASRTAGQADDLTITAKDASNNTITTYTGNHSLTFSGASSIGAFNPTVTNNSGLAVAFGTAESINFTSGVASPSAGVNGTMTLYKAEVANVSVTDGSHSSAAVAVIVSPAAADHLQFTTQPVGAVTEATNFSTQPTAAVKDAYGNTVTSDSGTITLAVNSYSAGASGGSSQGSLSCTNTGFPAVTASSGVVSFTGCQITGTAAAGTYTLKATRTGLTQDVSGNVVINAGTASKLSFTTQPSSGQNIQATGTDSFAVSVTVQDTNGNTVTTDSSSISLAINNNPGSGTVTCSNVGGLTVSASSGVASFTGCAITKTGTGYTLTATSSPSLTAPANANAFNITAGTASKLSFTTQPTAGQNIQATGTGSFSASVTVQDTNGNTVTTDSRSVTLAINNNAGPGGVLSCTNTGGLTVSASSGVASFTGCAITKTGTGYTLTASSSPALTAPANANSFNITAGAANKLSFTTQPSSGQNIQATGTGSFSASVAVQDTNGNTVLTDSRSVTLAINNNAGPGGVLSCTNTGGLTVSASSGVASFTGCAITKTGTGYTLTATSSPSLTAPTNANSFNITAGNTSQLVFTTQPGGTITGGTAFATQPVVTAEDANGNTVTSYSGTVTLSIKTGTPTSGGPGTLSGCAPSLSSGVTTFTGCKIDKSGTGYQLHATDTTLSADSATFNVNAGNAAKLSFTTSPSSSTGGVAFATQPVVTVQDAGGNTVSTDTSNVTLAIKTGTAGAALTCTANPKAAASGIATFAGCKIDKAGTGYVLTATDGSLTSADSNTFNISIGTAASLVLGATTLTPIAGAADSLTITAVDAGGNTVSGYTGSKSLTFGGANIAPDGTTRPTVTNSSGTATNFGTATAITFTSGQATASGANNGVMKLFKAETTSITVSDGSINNGTGLSVIVSAASPSVFKFTNCSVNGVTSACSGTVNVGNSPGHFDAHVSVFDTWLNAAAVTGSALTVTLSNSGSANYSISSNPIIAVGATESGSVTVTHLNNSTNNTVVATTNSGFTQTSITVAK